jgi:hypothetical protein
MIPPFPVRQGVYGASERCSPEIVAGIHGVQDQTGLHLVEQWGSTFTIQQRLAKAILQRF